MTPEQLPVEELRRCVNGLQLEVAVAGVPGNPVVVLLHGFPDFWQGWHYQIAPLLEAGFRILAPNQRGYGRSDKPPAVRDYDLDRLAEDVIALADGEGCQKFSLVGHDWGGLVAWWVSARFPERVERLVILNAPHPGAFWGYVLRSPSQFFRSLYVGFFQLPWLPEALFSRNQYELLFRSVQRMGPVGLFDDTDRRYLLVGWSQPGALTAMLNYYRAIARRSWKSLRLRVSVPTLILMSRQDPALEPGLAEASATYCDNVCLIWLEQGQHWIQREFPVQVTEQILSFLRSTH